MPFCWHYAYHLVEIVLEVIIEVVPSTLKLKYWNTIKSKKVLPLHSPESFDMELLTTYVRSLSLNLMEFYMDKHYNQPSFWIWLLKIHELFLDQVWSILPALKLLPLNCSHRRQKGSRTFMFFLGVIPVVALDTNGGIWESCSKGENPTEAAGMTNLYSTNGASWLMIHFIYFAKCVTCEINHHHHKASKLDSICVPSASELFGKGSDFANIEFQWKCCSISVNERDNS